MDGETFKHIISGEATGWKSGCWRMLFRAVSVPYRFGATVKNRLYDSGVIQSKRLDFPVVSVGNLTLGGTGKTPMIAYLADFFAQNGRKPAILSRGYGAAANSSSAEENRYSAHNDEWAELNERIGGIPHYQNKDRFAAGTALLRNYPDRNLFLLDDGFQYRRLFRDLDIILLDATEPFGYNALFPRGFLREPVDSLRRSDAVLLSRADLVSASMREEIRRKVDQIAPGKVWGEIRHQPTALMTLGPQSVREPFSPEKITDSLPFCGIGNPNGFFSMLENAGVSFADCAVFSDHHAYTIEDKEYLIQKSRKIGAKRLLTTMKDFVKLRQDTEWEIPLLAVEIGIDFLAGEEELRSLLREKIVC